MKSSKIVALLLTVITASGCKDTKNEIPSEKVSEEKS